MSAARVPNKNERIIAVLAAMRASTGWPLVEWLDGCVIPPEMPGIYAFLLQPALDGPSLPHADNWFDTVICLYAGVAEGSLNARMSDHKGKWRDAVKNLGMLHARGEALTPDDLSVRWVEFHDEANVAENTFLAAVKPLAAKPHLTKGGFGGKYRSADAGSWTVLGNLAVADSPDLATRLTLAAGLTAPFLSNIALIEEFSHDKYYEMGFHPGA
jgi:hypothetical protein